MEKYTREDLLKIIEKEHVIYIKLQFTDMLGTIKSVEIPANKVIDAIEGKVMFDGSSIEGFVRIKEADMYLKPDLNTFLILPMEESNYGKVARIICDITTPDGKPFIGDPRSNLKRLITEMRALGFENLNIGLEPEFYLFQTDQLGNPTLIPSDQGSYFDMSPVDLNESCRRDIVLELEKLGFTIEASHHEVGPGQNEINFKFSNCLEACDNVQTFKQIVKMVAKKHRLHATFMPKPLMNCAGSGMHVNCSLSDKEGKNLFYDETMPFRLSDLCQRWMSGIIKHSRALTLITNPTINSYKRLVPGYEAPVYICWSDANRSSMIRIPNVRGCKTRTEVRNVDCCCNPYLAIAGILMAGLDGIKNQLDYVEPVYDNIFEFTRDEREAKGILNLPENLKDAIKAFKKDDMLEFAVGSHIYKKYIIAKELEWDEYRKLITEWELKKYMIF